MNTDIYSYTKDTDIYLVKKNYKKIYISQDKIDNYIKKNEYKIYNYKLSDRGINYSVIIEEPDTILKINGISQRDPVEQKRKLDKLTKQTDKGIKGHNHLQKYIIRPSITA